jgi:hypothetical protein
MEKSPKKRTKKNQDTTGPQEFLPPVEGCMSFLLEKYMKACVAGKGQSTYTQTTSKNAQYGQLVYVRFQLAGDAKEPSQDCLYLGKKVHYKSETKTNKTTNRYHLTNSTQYTGVKDDERFVDIKLNATVYIIKLKRNPSDNNNNNNNNNTRWGNSPKTMPKKDD